MPASLSPLLGYNTNVRHKGKVFHVQTEDSGVRYGHVITHLFVDGGRILKSFKSSYAESVGTDQQGEVVRNLMRRQHKAMLLALRDGRFDQLADVTGATNGACSASAAEAPPAPSPRVLPSLPELDPSRSNASSALPRVQPSASQALSESASWRRSGSPASDPAVSRRGALPEPSNVDVRRAQGERRLVPSRPASAFGHAKVQGKSIFGEDPAADKSLDEVILSYLALDDGSEPKA